MEHILEFKYLLCVVDESGTHIEDCCRKVASVKRVAGSIKSLVNASAAVLYKSIP